jgi:hypothetical protein
VIHYDGSRCNGGGQGSKGTRQKSRWWVQELEVLGAEIAGAKIPGATTASTAIKDGGLVSQSTK